MQGEFVLGTMISSFGRICAKTLTHIADCNASSRKLQKLADTMIPSRRYFCRMVRFELIFLSAIGRNAQQTGNNNEQVQDYQPKLHSAVSSTRGGSAAKTLQRGRDILDFIVHPSPLLEVLALHNC
jgi:hypothetical protein